MQTGIRHTRFSGRPREQAVGEQRAGEQAGASLLPSSLCLPAPPIHLSEPSLIAPYLRHFVTFSVGILPASSKIATSSNIPGPSKVFAIGEPLLFIFVFVIHLSTRMSAPPGQAVLSVSFTALSPGPWSTVSVLFFGCPGSSLLPRLFLVAASQGHSLLWCVGFPRQWLLLLWCTGSRW